MADDQRTNGTEQIGPEDDPFACSSCGQPLGTVKRVEGKDYCDGCIREYVGEHAVRSDGGTKRPTCSAAGCERPAVAKMVTPLVDDAYRCLLDLEYDLERDFFEDDPAWDRSLGTDGG